MQNIFYNLSVNSALSNVVKTERRKKKKNWLENLENEFNFTASDLLAGEL